MDILGKKKIVVLGIMSRMPVPGLVWQTAHYLVGLERLGYEVYYVEAHGCTPGLLMTHPEDDGSARAAAYIARVVRKFDFADRWAFHDLHDGRCYGMEAGRLKDLYRSAEVVINLHGGTAPLPEHYASGRLVYLETDPVELQIELYDRLQETIDFLEPHCAFFTFGENYGRPDCGLPVSDRFHFRPTRQPVVTDFWCSDGHAPGEAFTTIGNWRQLQKQVVYKGEVYHWSKHREFLKLLDLPARTGRTFELALGSFTADDRAMLEARGWRVRPADAISRNADVYREYVVGSRGEFTVAKDQNVRLRSGWFSDRSATYLASGRPVVTQETGFSNVLPTGRGLFGFSTLDEAAAAVEAVEADYDTHRRAARDLARDCFEAAVVLRALLADVGV